MVSSLTPFIAILSMFWNLYLLALAMTLRTCSETSALALHQHLGYDPLVFLSQTLKMYSEMADGTELRAEGGIHLTQCD